MVIDNLHSGSILATAHALTNVPILQLMHVLFALAFWHELMFITR